MGSTAQIVVGIVAAILVISLLWPVTRRLWRFTYVVVKIALWSLLGIRHEGERLTRPRAARLLCEEMGPVFIKLGQIVASSDGMFPDAYVIEFQRCLDRVRPFSFAEVEQILSEDLADELENLDPEPLASASIAQVHGATLEDDTSVVVKVRRPGVDKLIHTDIKLMRLLARAAVKIVANAELLNPTEIVEDLAKTLREELDFRREADNMEAFNDIMADCGMERVRAPVPHRRWVTERVLTMERFRGARADRPDEIAALGLDAEEQLVRGIRAWFYGVIFHGFVHGDVHAGNLMLLEDGDVGFLDFGIVGRFDDEQRMLVTDYLTAFVTRDYDGLATTIERMDGTQGAVDREAFVADLRSSLEPLLGRSFGELDIMQVLPEFQRVATAHRLVLPRVFMLITKQILYFDRYAKLLAPDLNVFSDPRLVIAVMADLQARRSG